MFARFDRSPLSDADLVLAARRGEKDAIGLLFQRHRAHLHAAALSLVGYGGEADDAVHDTFLTSLTRLGELRDPAAVGGWLRAILRNRCLMELRRRFPLAGLEETERVFRDLPDETRIESLIESRDLRDWVWAALGRLPDMHRATVMLRYFSGLTSYQDIAAILGVPVGTVRSRLSDAKLKLSELLFAAAGLPDRDHEKLVAERRARFAEPLQAFARGGLERYVGEFHQDLALHGPGGVVLQGRGALEAMIAEDLGAGVRHSPTRVLASGGVTVVEAQFINPREDPNHCPPALAFVVFESDRRARRMHFHLAPRISERSA